MILPNEWKIGAHVYQVLCDPVALRDEHDWASHHPRSRMIAVETQERPESAVAEDLVHELLHALFLDAGQDVLDKNDEERVCGILAPRLVALLADNDQAVAQLLGMLK